MATVTNFANAFETTLTADMLGTDLTAQVQTTNGAPASPCYLVIDPHNDDKREYALFDGAFGANSFVTTALANRYLDGSAAASGITHAAGAIVRFAPVAQHFQNIQNSAVWLDEAQTITGEKTFSAAADFATANIDVMRAKNSPWFDVTHPDYGAVGDGVADDAAAIQAAVNAAQAAGGGVVFYPEGTYAVATSITATTAPVIHRGTGDGTVVAFTAAAGFSLSTPSCAVEQMKATGCRINVNAAATDAVIRDLYSTTSYSDAAIKIDANRVTVERCRFDSPAGPSVRLAGAASDCRILNNVIGTTAGTNTASSIQGDTGGTGKRNLVQGNAIFDAGLAAIEFGDWSHTWVVGNFIKDTRASLGGISLASCNDSLVAENYIETNGTYGIEIDAGTSNAHRCRITGNRLGGAPTLAGIELNAQGTQDMRDIEVTGNHIFCTTTAANTYAIRSTGSLGMGLVDSIIANNIGRDAFATGLHLAECVRVVVSGNRITYTTGIDGRIGINLLATDSIATGNVVQISTSAASIAMKLYTACVRLSIVGNHFDGGGVLERLIDAGTDTPSDCLLSGNVLVGATIHTARVGATSTGWTLGPNHTNVNILSPDAYAMAGQRDVYNPADFVGTGTPEGVVTARVGSTFRRTDGAAGTSLYVKESGYNTNTGWIAK